ncbi:hypothetical protein ACWEQL_01125 [Kitasatospora sp. NPDC004240]
MRQRPLLFLDIDGPLNPYAALGGTCPPAYTTVHVPSAARKLPVTGGRRSYALPRTVWLDPGHGEELLALGDELYELCWASAWMGRANQLIGPVLGLPRLPFVDFGDALFRERPDGVHWKCEPLMAYADGRPFAWVDDEQTDADHAHITATHPTRALLHHVNPRIGLRQDDFTALAAFASSLDGSAAAS